MRARRLATLVAAGSLVLAGTANSTALADSPRIENCVGPSGIDINANLDLSVAVVAPFCTEIKTGAMWVPAWFWTHAKIYEQVPDGFVPTSATPLEDFVAKFVAIRYVVDEGTKHEFAVEFANSPSLWTDEHPLNPDIDLASPMTLGAIRPLSKGPHTVTTFWIFSATHCDGFSSIFEESCVPAGVYESGTSSFNVVAK